MLDKKKQQWISSEFYLFKKATLKWRLFKKHDKRTVQEGRHYNRGEGTRCATHQLATINV